LALTKSASVLIFGIIDSDNWKEGELSRLAVRLAIETKSGINELKEILKSEQLYSGLNLTNGFVVNQAYLEKR
jgi:hypothetical protein